MGWEDAGLTVPRPLGWGGSGDCCSRYLTGPQEPLLQTCPSCLHLQPQSLSRLISFLTVSFFFLLFYTFCKFMKTFQLSSSTEKWSEVFLSEGIFLSDELSLQPRSPYQCGSDAGPSLVRVRRALQPQLGAASTTSEGSMHYRSRELTARILTFLLGLLRELQGRDAQSKCCALGTLS